MSHWRLFLLISCILISGCAMRTESRAHKSPAPASSGPSRTYTYLTPRKTVPGVHQPKPGVRQAPVTRPHHVASLSPRLQGFYRTNPTISSVGTFASSDNAEQFGSPEESDGDDNMIMAQPSGQNPSGHVIAAAGLFPIPEPNYTLPIAIVLVVAVLIYYGLYRIAGSGPKLVPTNPQLERSNSFRDRKDEYLQYDKDGKRIEKSDAKRERENVRRSECENPFSQSRTKEENECRKDFRPRE